MRKALMIILGMLIPLSCMVISPSKAGGVSLKTEGQAKSFNIRRIEVYGLSMVDRETFLSLFDIHKGMVSTEEIDRGIKRVFRMGLFEDIIVDFVPLPAGQRGIRKDTSPGTLRITVKEHPFINRIVIKGNDHIDEEDILKALPFREGDIMRMEKLREAEQALKALYKRRGFPEAVIKIDAIEIMKPRQYDIIIKINEGRPLIIREIVIRGYEPWIKAEMDTGINDIYDTDQVKKDLERLREYLYRKGYYNPSVTPSGFREGRLTIDINTGKRLVPVFTGNHEFSSEELEEIISLKGVQLDSDTIAEASERIVRAYHKRGYPYTLVSPELREKDKEVEVRFYINEGRRYTVGHISIKGNSLPSERIKEVMATKEGGPFNPDLLDDDRDAIQAFYRGLGYMNAVIKDMSYQERDDEMDIRILISEGRQSRIKKIEFFGNSVIPTRELLDYLPAREGSVYNELLLFDIKREVLNAYHERGYLDASVEIAVESDREENIHIKIEIREGHPCYFGKTIVRGNRTTSLVVIMRELNYREGDPLNTRLLPRLSKRLYQLGLFRDVKITIIDPYSHIAPGKRERTVTNKRDILIEVTERKQGVFEFGVGYGEYEGLRGFLDIRYNNLWGMNRTAGMRLQMSDLKRRLLLTYNEPYFLNRKLKLNAVFQYSERKEKNVDTGEIRYRVRRYSADLSVEKRLSKRIRLNLTYGYALVKTFDVEPGIVLSREDTGTLAISSIMPGIIYDSRDNPFNPRRGVFAGASLKFASQLLLGETDFAKFNYHFSIYHALSKRVVLAFSLRGGLAESFKDTRDLPLVERYFLGGRNSVRGFPQDGLGPKASDGTPTGGNIYIASNLEFRTYVGRGFSVVTFVDSGNVWQKLSNINSSLRFTAGLGLRYNTPVGPIRIDYGHKLDRREGESAGEIHFSIGHAF